jgi:polynucleotide 5'-hydroxyl-kinase GRC3/NOL9
VERYNVPFIWKKLAENIKSNPGTVIILGAVDTGKTYLAYYLIRECIKDKITSALIDTDLGQSSLGPPATIGLRLFKNMSRSFTNLKPHFMRFVGSVSPVGCLMQTITGAKKMLEKAISLGAKAIIVDTTGFIDSPIARELKFQKIDLLDPRHIIMLERANELEAIIRPYLRKKELFIHRLKPVEYISFKTQTQRRKNREKKFQCYFKGAIIKEISIKRFGLHGIIPEFNKEELKDLLVAFCDRNQDALALGIIEDFYPIEEKIRVRTPLSSFKEISSIQFGILKVNREGRHYKR